MNKFYVCFLVMLLAFSCNEDDPQTEETKTILPALGAVSVNEVGVHNARASGKIVRLATDSITNYGFVYASKSISSLSDGEVIISYGPTSELKEFSYYLTDLEKSKQYYLRAFVSTADTTVYTSQVIITTKNVNEWYSFLASGVGSDFSPARYGVASEGVAYLGFGSYFNFDGTEFSSLYEYVPHLNTATRISDCPEKMEIYTPRFSQGGNLYVILGSTHIWQFNRVSGTWKQLNDFPVNLSVIHTFSLYNQTYAVGTNEANGRAAEMWQYNEVDDKWNLFSTVPPYISTLPPDVHGVMQVNNKVYIVVAQVTSNPKLYEFDPLLNKYTLLKDLPFKLPEGDMTNYGLSSTSYGFFFPGAIWRYNPSDDSWLKINRPGSSKNPFILNNVLYLVREGSSLFDMYGIE